MANLMPGDIKTEPRRKLTFNAPFSEKNRYHVTIANLANHRIAWATKSTNPERLVVEPPAGVLDPNRKQMLFVTQETFNPETEGTNDDRMTFVWTRAPPGCCVPPRPKEGAVRGKWVEQLATRGGGLWDHSFTVQYNL